MKKLNLLFTALLLMLSTLIKVHKICPLQRQLTLIVIRKN